MSIAEKEGATTGGTDSPRVRLTELPRFAELIPDTEHQEVFNMLYGVNESKLDVTDDEVYGIAFNAFTELKEVHARSLELHFCENELNAILHAIVTLRKVLEDEYERRLRKF